MAIWLFGYLVVGYLVVGYLVVGLSKPTISNIGFVGALGAYVFSAHTKSLRQGGMSFKATEAKYMKPYLKKNVKAPEEPNVVSNHRKNIIRAPEKPNVVSSHRKSY